MVPLGFLACAERAAARSKCSLSAFSHSRMIRHRQSAANTRVTQRGATDGLDLSSSPRPVNMVSSSISSFFSESSSSFSTSKVTAPPTSERGDGLSYSSVTRFFSYSWVLLAVCFGSLSDELWLRLHCPEQIQDVRHSRKKQNQAFIMFYRSFWRSFLLQILFYNLPFQLWVAFLLVSILRGWLQSCALILLIFVAAGWK